MGNKAETEIERSDRLTKAWSERCGSCIYRGAQPPQSCCNYILITGHMRGCPVEGCSKYEKGEKIIIVEDVDMKGRELKYSKRERGRRQQKSRDDAARKKWAPPATRIGIMIDAHLEKTGLPQSALARELEIDGSTLSGWRLKAQRLKPENVEKLARVLGVSAEEVQRAVKEEWKNKGKERNE